MEINQDFVTVGSVILAKMETKARFVIARQQKLGQKNPSFACARKDSSSAQILVPQLCRQQSRPVAAAHYRARPLLIR